MIRGKGNKSFLNIRSNKNSKTNVYDIIENVSLEENLIINKSLNKNNAKSMRLNIIKELKNITMSYILKKANNYIHACVNGKLKNGIKKSSKNPRITTLTAFYNREKTIKAAIRSIQNQNMPDIEILLINDASTDNSLNISKILQKQDPRIKIINNKENMGPLYSKSIGVLNANGKYIIYLDSDDLFINENLFNICYEEAEKNNIDILEFSGFQSKYKYLNVSKKQIIPLYLRYKENNLTITQPQLSTFIYKKKKIKSLN